ncbi:MAG TPA: TIGR02270 family protein [Myxococcota bacterium]|nr:TIGR02270 family protein [Myxococcota bacterium]
MSRPIAFTPAEISARMLPAIVSVHAEEAAFLWTQRAAAVSSPKYALKDLAKLDSRVEAQLEGLRVAGSYGWGVSEKALEEGGAGEIFAAGVLAFGSEGEGRIAKVLAAGSATPQHERGLISALGWLPSEAVRPQLTRLVASQEPELRRIAIAAWAVQRRDPGAQLTEAAFDPHARLRARALRAAGELGRTDLASALQRSLHDIDEDARFYAAWSLARLGDRSEAVMEGLRRTAEGSGAHAAAAASIWARCEDPGRLAASMRGLSSTSRGRRLLSIAAGAAGSPDFVPELLALMDDDRVAKVAGEAFSMITGVDLEYADLDRDGATSVEQAEEEMPIADPDDILVLPDRASVERWWKKNEARFNARRCYLCGREKTVEGLRACLAQGKQRQRAAAALELALMDPTRELFEVRARADRQLAELRPWMS